MIDFNKLLSLFKKRLNRWAKLKGFIKRQRNLSAKDFLILMTIGQSDNKKVSLV